jgi:hypothetical protein
MFNKTIIAEWIDPDNFNQYLISFDDNGVLFLTERLRTDIVK